MAAAKLLVARVDALGKPALLWQLKAHCQLLDYYEKEHDAVGIRSEAVQIITLGHDIPNDTLTDDFGGLQLVMAYKALMKLAFDAYPDSMSVIAQRAKRDLGGWKKRDQVGLSVGDTSSVDEWVDALGGLEVTKTREFR